jgi:hypothetical protein
MRDLGIESTSLATKATTKRVQGDIPTPLEHFNNTDSSKKSRLSCESPCRDPSTFDTSTLQAGSGSPISVALPSSFTSSSSGKKATTSGHDISRDPSYESLLGVSMELDVDDSQTNFLYVDGSFAARSRTESTYLRPEELPPSKVSTHNLYELYLISLTLSQDEDTLKFRNEGNAWLLNMPHISHSYSNVMCFRHTQ